MNSHNYKPIEDHIKYAVDTEGNVWNIDRGNTLRPSIDHAGYMSVTLNGKRKYLHRLVALAFIPNPDSKPYVNHIDYNPNNNKVSNLEWCTKAENDAHSRYENKQGVLPSIIKNGKRHSVSIYIKKNNEDRWKAIADKSEWVNTILDALPEPEVKLQPIDLLLKGSDQRL